MTRVFENPANGYLEEVDGSSAWGAFFFGVFYFFAKGLWQHALILLGVVLALTIATGGPGIFFAVPAWIIYAVMTPGLLAANYLKKGWKEVDGAPIMTSSADSKTGISAAPSRLALGERTCPFCAETIKAAAIKCKHCGSEITPVEFAPAATDEAMGAVAIPTVSLADGDMACSACNKHIPADAWSCAFCGHQYRSS